MGHCSLFCVKCNLIKTNDISLRAAASANLRHLIDYVGLCGMNDEDRTDTLEKHLLPLILKGLHVDNEVIFFSFAVNCLLVNVFVFLSFHCLLPIVFSQKEFVSCFIVTKVLVIAVIGKRRCFILKVIALHLNVSR